MALYVVNKYGKGEVSNAEFSFCQSMKLRYHLLSGSLQREMTSPLESEFLATTSSVAICAVKSISDVLK